MKNVKVFLGKISAYQKGLFLVFLTWGVYFSFLFPRVFFRTAEGIWAGIENVWADWPAHFTMAMPFAYGKISDWLTYHPLFPEKKFTYPFLVDALSGLLIRFGFNPVGSFWLPSLLMILFLLWSLYRFAFNYCQTAGKTFLVISIFLAGGGLGFIFFLQSLQSDLNTILKPLQEYTHWEEKGIFWINVVSSEFVPQRSFPLGMGLALLFLGQWLKWLKNGFADTKNWKILLNGFLVGLMMLIHTHSFLVLFFAGSLFLLSDWKNRKKWLLLAFGTFLSFLPIFLFFYLGQIQTSFFSWQIGWLSKKAPFFGNWFFFWLINWGFFLPLVIWSSWKTGFYRQTIFVFGILLFLLSNLFLFQPWDWDNSKILTFSYFFLSFPVAIYLGDKFKVGGFGALGALVCFFILTFSGGLDLYRLLLTEQRKNLLWSAEEIKMAEDFRQIASPGDEVLVSDQHNQFIRCLTDAKTPMAYRGWLWSYGIDYAKVSQDIAQMYLGSDESRKLLKQYKIKYVVIGPIEKKEWFANEKFFQENFSLILKNEEYEIFKIE